MNLKLLFYREHSQQSRPGSSNIDAGNAILLLPPMRQKMQNTLNRSPTPYAHGSPAKQMKEKKEKKNVENVEKCPTCNAHFPPTNRTAKTCKKNKIYPFSPSVDEGTSCEDVNGHSNEGLIARTDIVDLCNNHVHDALQSRQQVGPEDFIGGPLSSLANLQLSVLLEQGIGVSRDD
jgi:hypothetical protein